MKRSNREGIGLKNLDALRPAHWATVGLAAITGTIHMYLYWTQEFLPFLFAGVVFYAAIAGLLLNVYPRVLYALGIPFTAGQIAIWYVQGMPDMQIAVVDKPIQVLLIVFLGYLLWVETRTKRASETVGADPVA